MKKQTIKIIAGIVLAVIIIVAFGLGLKYIEKSGQKKGDNTRTQHSMYVNLVIDENEYETNHNIESYLLFGTDENGSAADSPEGYHGGMVDFLMLIMLDKTTERYAFVEIDRNTMFDVTMIAPDGSMDYSSFQQICGANWYGHTPVQGAENMTKTVSELFGGLPINGYFAIGIEDFHRLNDAVGGVTVTIPDDDLSKADPAFKKGAEVKLSNKQAELFVRSRMSYGNGTNESRLARQRIFLNALLRDLKVKVKNDPKVIDKIFNELEDFAVTDMNAGIISKIANQVTKSEKIEGSDDVGIVQLEGEHTTGKHLDDGIEHEEFYCDYEALASMLEKAIGLKNITY